VWPSEWIEVKLYSSMTAALEGGEWSAVRSDRTLPPGKTQYPFYKRLGGNRREYEEYFLGGKVDRCLRLTILPPSFVEYLEILKP
jgi:hypothetical protein